MRHKWRTRRALRRECRGDSGENAHWGCQHHIAGDLQHDLHQFVDRISNGGVATLPEVQQGDAEERAEHEDLERVVRGQAEKTLVGMMLVIDAWKSSGLDSSPASPVGTR